jgi:hypothetical protein
MSKILETRKKNVLPFRAQSNPNFAYSRIVSVEDAFFSKLNLEALKIPTQQIFHSAYKIKSMDSSIRLQTISTTFDLQAHSKDIYVIPYYKKIFSICRLSRIIK